MIIGIGSDLCDIRRIEQSLARHGERFTHRLFTEVERARAEGRAHRAATYAKRFAAKEACAKALGTGIRRGVFWRDMGVVNLASGRPTMELTGGAAAMLSALTPAGHTAVIHLSITDDQPWAQAFVIIEALPLTISPDMSAAG
ncbi:holo-ACP synthase [Phreatobacter sp.]|uniref:holo-ACP synthase n=1 Tax=Phreatobacter sp. TaxID=1966341 RepID=UPI003F6ED596